MRILPRSLALVLAASAAWSAMAVAADALPDSTVRLPGSPLRLGWTLERLSAHGNFRLLRRAGDETLREAETRWFGAPAFTQATFQDGRLVKLRLELLEAAPHTVDYALDALRREGYRRVSWTPAGDGAETEWLGRTRVTVSHGRKRIVAEFSPFARPEPPVPPPPAPDTLDFLRAEVAAELPAPVRRATPASAPQRPAAAVEAGVYGRVLVCVTVDTTGAVIAQRVLRGAPELEAAALAWAREVRFDSYRHQGRAVAFRVGVPVLFLPPGTRDARP